MKIYISGPMTGLPENNYPAFFEAAVEIRDKGHEPINPADGAPFGWKWEQYLRRDLRMLLDADAVYMLPGWENSRGAALERRLAYTLRMPVRYFGNKREFFETCDNCGTSLDQLKGEDFYDEPSGRVYCAKHWPHEGEMNVIKE